MTLHSVLKNLFVSDHVTQEIFSSINCLCPINDFIAPLNLCESEFLGHSGVTVHVLWHRMVE